MEIIGIIDYGSGNIHSATKAFENVAKDLKKEIKILRIHNAADIKLCDRVVLPGVGGAPAGLAGEPPQPPPAIRPDSCRRYFSSSGRQGPRRRCKR